MTTSIQLLLYILSAFLFIEQKVVAARLIRGRRSVGFYFLFIEGF